jgi:ankyrin repeat protein
MTKTKTSQEELNRHLWNACTEGHVEYAKLALKSGADPNSQTPEGLTPLHRAAANGHPLLIDHLLQYGADLAARTRDGATPLDIAGGHNHGFAADILEIAAKQHGHAGRVTAERQHKGPASGGRLMK